MHYASVPTTGGIACKQALRGACSPLPDSATRSASPRSEQRTHTSIMLHGFLPACLSPPLPAHELATEHGPASACPRFPGMGCLAHAPYHHRPPTSPCMGHCSQLFTLVKIPICIFYIHVEHLSYRETDTPAVAHALIHKGTGGTRRQQANKAAWEQCCPVHPASRAATPAGTAGSQRLSAAAKMSPPWHSHTCTPVACVASTPCSTNTTSRRASPQRGGGGSAPGPPCPHAPR